LDPVSSTKSVSRPNTPPGVADNGAGSAQEPRAPRPSSRREPPVGLSRRNSNSPETRILVGKPPLRAGSPPRTGSSRLEARSSLGGGDHSSSTLFHSAVQSFADVGSLNASGRAADSPPTMETLDISSGAVIHAASVGHASASTSASDSPQALAETHENWKNGAHTKRQAFFGAHYSPEMDSATFDKKFIEMGRGLEPAALAFVTQGLSSAITFGTRGGVATSLKALGYGAGAAGAMAGLPMGVANFLTERLVLAPINHASKQMKRPVLTPVPPEVMYPDRSPVKSVVVNGQVRLERKSPQEILHDKKEVQDLRQDVARWQARATSKGFGSHSVAVGVAGGNAARRLVHHFPSGPAAGGETTLASGIGGGLGASALGMMKASLFAEVDNLNGGSQTLPMFVIKDSPADSAAQEGDSHPVVQFAKHMGTHAADQVKAMANKPMETLTEALVTNMFANVVGSFLGESAAAQVNIGDKESTATVAVGQMIQSYITSSTYRQSKNSFQVPEQNNWAGDIGTQRAMNEIAHSTAVDPAPGADRTGLRQRSRNNNPDA
jgi:hypothetical protein